MSYLSTGSISDAGEGLSIDGDPVIALLAQLNRFAGKTLAPAAGASSRKYVTNPFDLVTGAFDQRAALSAITILVDRYQYAPTSSYDKSKVDWAISGYDNPQTFVLANLQAIVPSIALFGDKLGLAAAEVGITKRSSMFTPSITAKQAMIGALAIGAIYYLNKKRK